MVEIRLRKALSFTKLDDPDFAKLLPSSQSGMSYLGETWVEFSEMSNAIHVEVEIFLHTYEENLTLSVIFIIEIFLVMLVYL